MYVKVKTVRDANFGLDVADDATVLDVKKQIYELQNIDVTTHGIKLIFAGKVLDDAEKLETYRVENNSTLVMMTTKLTPAPAPQAVPVHVPHEVPAQDEEAFFDDEPNPFANGNPIMQFVNLMQGGGVPDQGQLDAFGEILVGASPELREMRYTNPEAFNAMMNNQGFLNTILQASQQVFDQDHVDELDQDYEQDLGQDLGQPVLPPMQVIQMTQGEKDAIDQIAAIVPGFTAPQILELYRASGNSLEATIELLFTL
jgi:hypothetical protein